MLNKRELGAIRSALPVNGYQLIAERCGKSSDVVGKILNDPKRYNSTVIEKALEVIAEYKALALSQKNKLKELTSCK